MVRKANPDSGYTLLILLFALTVLTLGLMVAIPVWQTQIQREKEEELIFRGNQYVEAIRLFQLKNQSIPEDLEELLDEKCIRRLYRDPMTRHGEWNLILIEPRVAAQKKGTPQRVLVVPFNMVSAVRNPQIIGVVSSSTQKSFKIFDEQESYDRWLFFYGKDPEKLPEIVYYGQEENE